MTAPSATVISLRSRGTRSLAAIRDDLAVLLREVDGILAVQNGGVLVPANPLAQDDRVLTLGRAADEIGWDEQRLRKAIVRQIKAKVPASERFAWQPGGVTNSPWQVDMARLHRYIRNLPPNTR